MISLAVNVVTVAVIVGLGIAVHAFRDCVMALEDRLDRVEKLQRKQALTLAEHELLADQRDHRRAVA